MAYPGNRARHGGPQCRRSTGGHRGRGIAVWTRQERITRVAACAIRTRGGEESDRTGGVETEHAETAQADAVGDGARHREHDRRRHLHDNGIPGCGPGPPLFIFALWIVGGVLALSGALGYAELGAMMPDASAKYVYLRETRGPKPDSMSPGSGIPSTAGSWSSTRSTTELRFPEARRQTPKLPTDRPGQTLSATPLTLSSRNAPSGYTSGPGPRAQ